MGNQAGLSRAGGVGGIPILKTSSASADSGPQLIEAKFWKSWTFQLIGTFTGYSVSIYGTIDPATAGLPGAPGASANWFLLPAPSVEGSGDVTQFLNPLTAVAQVMYYPGLLCAVRAVATGTGQTGTVTVLAAASP